MAQLPPPPFQDQQFSWKWRKWLNDNWRKTVYRGALMQKTSSQSITGNAFNPAGNKVTFDTTRYDTGGLADLTNNRLIVPNDGHRIQLAACTVWDPAGVTTNVSNSMRCINIAAYNADGTAQDPTADEGTEEHRLANIPGIVPLKLGNHFNSITRAFSLSLTTGIMDVQPGDQFELFANSGANVDLVVNTGPLISSAEGYHSGNWFSMIVYG